MAIITNNIELPQNHGHLIRPRINSLLAQAIKAPLTVVCAGMGCGKTCAVYDFAQQCNMPVLWLQFANIDNPAPHFWQMLVNAIAQTSKPLAKELKSLGLPDSPDKLNIYFDLRKRMQSHVRRLYVLDDLHLIKDVTVLNFFEQVMLKMSEEPSLMTPVVVISRVWIPVNISSLIVRNKVSIINEEELNFTENELHQFLLQQGLTSEINNLAQIYRDTAGWPFIINFVAQILKKIPGYMGYARTAIRRDIAQLIEAEVWNTMSTELQRFFLRLSLTTHRSMELVNILTDGDERLLAELNQQNVFVHYDRFINAYRVHHLFLDFLQTKQGVLSDDAIRSTRKAIADWCYKNDFIIDALSIYEKIGDYAAIASLLFASPAKFFNDNARHIVGIFHRAPEEVFDRVEFAAAMHIQLVLCSGQWREALDLMQLYEAKYLRLPENDAFRNRMLGCIYYYWGLLRVLLCTEDDRYDFDTYFAKQYAYLKNFPVNPKCWYQHYPGVWSCLMSSPRASAAQKYIAAVIRGSQYQQNAANGLTAGIGELCQSELLFYQGDMRTAESYANKAIEKARDRGQYEIVSRALFYLMRIAVFYGDYQKLELSLKDVERQLPSHEYSALVLTYDIVLGWYYCVLGQARKVPDWLRGEFVPLADGLGYENFGNYLKAKYCYLTEQYAHLLAYLKKEKQRKIALLERVELLAVEACVYLKMHDAQAAPAVLQEAYQLALPNGIVAPFIELGKDMRMLINLAARCQNCTIPRPWLKNVQQKASIYSRNQALIISGYQRTHEAYNKIPLSPRETVIFHDLCAGLSRSEIAAKYNLSINTVKLHINSIYSKLGARNRADMFRLAAENNLM